MGFPQTSLKPSGNGKTITITRPNNATQYGVGDVVGDASGSAIFEITGLGKANGQFLITAAHLYIARASLPTGMTAGFNLHVFNESPTAVADNDAFTLPNADLPKFQDTIQLALPSVKAGSVISQNSGLSNQVTLSATGSLFVELETLSALTPTASMIKYLLLRGLEV
jgi:hypothetical protein